MHSTRVYFESRKRNDYKYFDDDLRVRHTQHLPVPLGPFGGVTPMHIIHAYTTFFVGLCNYGATASTKYSLDTPIALTLFKDGIIDLIVTTDANLFNAHVQAMRNHPLPQNEQEFALLDYRVGGTTVGFYARLIDTLTQWLETHNIDILGSCEVVFPSVRNAPRDTSIAGLHLIKKVDTHGLLLYNMNLTENRLTLSHGTVRSERRRSRSPRR